MDRVSTHPFVYSNDVWGFINKNDDKALNLRENTTTEIGNDVWIGQGALILPNVKVGDGAIVGAHAVVTKDVEPYSIVVGNPARVIKYRFDKKTIAQLLDIKWWNWTEEKLRKHISLFNDISEFIKNEK